MTTPRYPLARARRDSSGRLWFREDAPVTAARVQRLHEGLALNYASVGLVLDLLDRITELETALRRRTHPGKEAARPWT
jgi:chaperone modulatory protein CbpM